VSPRKVKLSPSVGDRGAGLPMVDTFQGVAVFVLAILPGALYIWGIESVTGAWGLNFADRVLRFIAFSAIIQVLLLPLTYWFWVRYVKVGYFAQGKPLHLSMVESGIAYVIVPYILGRIVGRGVGANNSIALALAGRRPGAPRAWDQLFREAARGWVVLKLTSGTYLGGVYLGRSYASAYPEPQELFLADQVFVDPDSGDFITGTGAPLRQGQVPERMGRGLLVRWDEVEYLEWYGS
jgi:Family of unknown function (DUF6338)